MHKIFVQVELAVDVIFGRRRKSGLHGRKIQGKTLAALCGLGRHANKLKLGRKAKILHSPNVQAEARWGKCFLGEERAR